MTNLGFVVVAHVDNDCFGVVHSLVEFLGIQVGTNIFDIIIINREPVGDNLLFYLDHKLPKRIRTLQYADFEWHLFEHRIALKVLFKSFPIVLGNRALGVDALVAEINTTQNTEFVPCGKKFVTQPTRIIDTHIAIERNGHAAEILGSKLGEAFFFGQEVFEMGFVHRGSVKWQVESCKSGSFFAFKLTTYHFTCYNTLMIPLTSEKELELRLKANDIRMSIISMLRAAGSGHTAGSLDMADIFAAFYFHILNHEPQNPEWDERDRLILSNGHIAPVRYATMAHAGYFPIEELATLRQFGSRLQGHPEREHLPGLETTSGPLGEGLGQAAGMALAARMDGKKHFVYCCMGDGELNEGNIWESVMFASANNLGNLIGVVDRNSIQINGMTEDVMPLEPLADKWEAFGWHVLEIDGHNIEQFVEAVAQAQAIVDKPTVILARTIPSKGISEIEYDYEWHGKPPSAEEEGRWLTELQALQEKIMSER